MKTVAVSDSSLKATDPYRVLVVDDSAVIRGLIARWLETDSEISVVGTAGNGVLALRYLSSLKPELVILDIEMPEMDGMTALPKMIEAIPDIQVIMASTLTRRNAEISLQALANGAADYVPKPETNREVNGSAEFRQQIISKVKALGSALRKSRRQTLPTQAGSTGYFGEGSRARTASSEILPVQSRRTEGNRIIKLRHRSSVPPKVLAIGSSTGGPQALMHVFGELKGKIELPILITQHMPATFTSILADHLARITGQPCSEAKDGEAVCNGAIYVAPGNYHLTLERGNSKNIIRLKQGPQENYCRPAVDPMFRSVAEVYGNAALCVVLTGMGYDGLKGAEEIVRSGGTVVAQDEDSSVVWGMPGAVSMAGLCSVVPPLKDMASSIIKIINGGGA